MISDQLEYISKILSEARAKAEDKLTEQQFIEAMRQALACGDFLRYVRVDNGGQTVTYTPYRERKRLQARIRELEERLKAIAEGKPVINPEWEALGPAMDIVLD